MSSSVIVSECDWPCPVMIGDLSHGGGAVRGGEFLGCVLQHDLCYIS